MGKRQQAPAAFDLELLMAEHAGRLKIVLADGMDLIWDGQEAVLAFEDSEQDSTGIGRGRSIRRARIRALREVRILADTSLAEIYLNRGEVVFTTRYYPDADAGSLFAEGDVQEAVLWEMAEKTI